MALTYIIFDLEWNQPYAHDIGFMKRTGVPIAGEIIQIGAIKLNAALEEVDRFMVFVKPEFLKHMHKHVADLTNITQRDLEKGLAFRHAYETFDEWCGEDAVLLSWGSDDIMMLADNLLLHRIKGGIRRPWFDAQRIFAYERHGDAKQYSLQSAMEELAVDGGDLAAHDALHDAIFTARICAHLKLAYHVEHYEAIVSKDKGPIFFPDPTAFFVYEGFIDKNTILDVGKVKSAFCPKCGARLRVRTPERIGGDRYLSIGTCATHGAFALHWRIGKYMLRNFGARYCVSKMLFESTERLERLYEDKKEINRLKAERYKRKLGLMKAGKDGRDGT